MKLINRLFILTVMMFSSLNIFAQITGKVVDSKTGNELIGANVYIEGNTRGTSTNVSGEFSLNSEPSGNLVVSFIGYETLTLPAKTDMGTITLSSTALGLDEASVIANVVDFAQNRETPVAVSTIGPSEIALKVGNMEFPEVMNRTPGVYATKQGGGYGDSRISLRGFDPVSYTHLTLPTKRIV